MLDGGLQSLDGGATHRFTPSAAEEYSINYVEFDGTNDYLIRDTVMSNYSAHKNALFSVWVKFGTGNTGYRYMLTGRYTRTRIQLRSFKLVVDFRDAVNAYAWWFKSTDNIPSDGSAVHILAALDAANTTGHVYLNDVALSAAEETLQDKTVQQSPTWNIGSSNSENNKWYGSMGDLWYNDEYLDISVESNRRKFIDAEGNPVSLGSDGSEPTGNVPFIFYTGAAAVWNAGTNSGNGGDMTMVGSVDDE